MTTNDEVKPTEGAPAQSYEYIFDVAVPVGAEGTPVWVNCPDITGLNPQFQSQLQDITTYAHKGQQSQSKVGSTFTLGFNVLKIRDDTGQFQAYWQMLKDASDKNGGDNEILFRYYDAQGADDAYQGTAGVQRDARPESGPTGVGWDAFTLTGTGTVVPIENPAVTSGGV